MIPVSEALALDTVRGKPPAAPIELSLDDQALFDYLDATIETGVLKDFDGGVFRFKVPKDFAPLHVVEALKVAYEAGGWLVGVFATSDDSDDSDAQMVFAPRLIRAVTPVVRPPRPQVNARRPKVLLVSDVPGWAFDVNMKDLAEYLKDEFDFAHFYTETWFRGIRPNWHSYDVVYECFHRNPTMGIPMDRILGALRSEWWAPEAPGPLNDPKIINAINAHRGFQVATRRNYEELRDHCPNVIYLTNPIDTRRFTQTPVIDRIAAEWNGNAGHLSKNGRLIKHFRDVVQPACKQAGVPLVSAEYGVAAGPARQRTSQEMPAFYHQANVALCASEYEAASNSVMEAMASGLALIATDVGNHRELQQAQLAAFGDTGILLVAGNVAAFVKALQELTPARARRMGEINRAEILARWSWDIWAPRYAAFLRMALVPVAVAAPAVTPVPPASIVIPTAPTSIIPTSPAAPSALAPAPAVDFSWWNKIQAPAQFLANDHDNPSRAWVGKVVLAEATRLAAGKPYATTLVEVGPGPGVDYARQFQPLRLSQTRRNEPIVEYTAYEGSKTLCDALRGRFPEATWVNQPLATLPQDTFDIVYAKAVLEHQPALEPSLSILLQAARECVIIVWYRPPAARAEYNIDDKVHYHTFRDADVQAVLARRGWCVAESQAFSSGNLGWVLRRI